MPLTIDQIRADRQARRAAAAPPPPVPQTAGENFGAGVRSSIHQTAGMFYGLAAMAGETLGNQELLDFGREGAKRKQLDAVEWAPRVQSLKDIDTIDDFIDWTAGTLGNVVPSMGVTLGTGAVGAAVGRKVIAKKLRNEAEKRAVAAMTAEGVSEPLAKSAVQRLMKDPANQKRIMTHLKRGAMGGAFVGSTAINTGDLYNELKDAGVQDSPGWAMGGGALMGALDIVTEGLMLQDLTQAAVKKQLTESIGKAIGKGALKYGAIEGTTEGLQEAVAIGTRALADPTFDPTDDQSIQRLLDSFAAGAIVGVLGGAGSGAVGRLTRPAPEDDAPPADESATTDEMPASVQPPPAGDTGPGGPVRRNYNPGQGGDEEAIDLQLQRREEEVESPPDDLGGASDFDPADGLTNMSGQPTRLIGAHDMVGETEADIAPHTWAHGRHQNIETPPGSVTTRLGQLREQNPGMLYEAMPTKGKAGEVRWYIEERAPPGGADMMFDKTTRTQYPVSEGVQRMADDAVQSGRNVGGMWETPREIFQRQREQRLTDADRAELKRLQEGRQREVDLTDIFDFVDYDTGEVVRRNVKLTLNRITSLGMTLDNDKTGPMADRARRGFEIGLSELMQTPVLLDVGQESGGGKQRVGVRPSRFINNGRISLQPNKILYELRDKKTGARSHVRVGGSGKTDSPLVSEFDDPEVEPRANEYWEHENRWNEAMERGDSPLTAQQRKDSASAGRVIGASNSAGIPASVDGPLASGTERRTLGGMMPKGAEKSASFDPTAEYATNGRATVSDPEMALTLQGQLSEMQTDDDQGSLAADAVNKPEATSSSELGGYTPRVSEGAGAANDSITDDRLGTRTARLQRIVHDLAKRLKIKTTVHVMNIEPEVVELLRTPDEVIRARPENVAKRQMARKKKATETYASLKRLQQRFGMVDGAVVHKQMKEGLESGEKGFVVHVQGQAIIFVDPTLKEAEYIRVFAHEMGHVVTKENFDRLTPRLRGELETAFLREGVAGKAGQTDFNEWLADQFVAWVSRRSIPRSIMERWLKTTGDQLHKLWTWLKGRYNLNETFKQFMDASVGFDFNLSKSEFSEHFAALGEAANPRWAGLPTRSNFTPPRDAAAWAKGRIKPWIMKFEGASRTADGFRKLAMQVWNTFFASQDGIVHRMRTVTGERIPALQKFWKNFSLRAGEAGGLTYPQQVKHWQGLWAREMGDAKAAITRRATFGGKLDKEMAKRLEKKLIAEMRKWDGDPTKTPAYDPEIQSIAEVARASFDKIHDWATDAGLPLRKIPNYFPRVVDQRSMVERKSEFIDVVRAWGKANGGQLQTEQEILDIYDALMQHSHVIDFNDLFSDSQSTNATYAAAMQHRKLPDGLAKALDSFYLDDLSTIMTTYAHQVAKRVEFHKFGGGDMEAHKAAYAEWAFARESQLKEWQNNNDDRGRLNGEYLEAALRVAIGDPPRWDPAGKLKDMMKAMDEQGLTPEDRRTLEHILLLNFGRVGNDMPLALRRAMGQVLLYQNMRLLVFTTISALPDLAAPMIRGNGIRASLRSYVRAYKDTERRQMLQSMMQTWGLAMQHYTEHIMADGVGGDPQLNKVYEWSDKFFTWTGVKHWEQFSRTLSISVGVDYLLDAADKGKTAALTEVGLTAQDVKTWDANGRRVAYVDGPQADPIDAKIHQALVRFMYESRVAGINPAQKTMWGSNPKFMLLWHLKSYMYEFQHRVLGRIAHQMNSSDVTSEQLRFVGPVVLAMALAAFGLELRELIQYSLWGKGDEARTDQMGGAEYLFTLLERSGFLGMMQYLTDVVGASMNGRAPLLTLVGPTVGQINDVIQRPGARTAAAAIPVVNNFTGARDYMRDVFRGAE